MPLVDMPLEQLRTYAGRNPRPDDFDAYWDKALSEMRSVDPKVELVPAAFQTASPSASTCTSPACAARGSTPSCCGRRSRAARPRPSAVPRLYRQRRRLDRVPGLCRRGLHRRGAGLPRAGRLLRGCRRRPRQYPPRAHHPRPARSPEKLLFRDIYLDTAQLAGMVMDMPEVDASRVGAGVVRRAAA